MSEKKLKLNELTIESFTTGQARLLVGGAELLVDDTDDTEPQRSCLLACHSK
ncbi:pinensin family lanthipeptide [Roseivirga sp. BDSF3-8]|uniref:pinensin family lanthipeptide n=1 Tax=Roseivirga sp. BDSF3-8 TaxID=3241598 RepID=UPI0035321331